MESSEKGEMMAFTFPIILAVEWQIHSGRPEMEARDPVRN